MEQTELRQSVNFLGFLRSQLSGLHGIPTLCYELIQNADDVKDVQGNPAATSITFDVCDDALYVENDGVFREIDFERMQNVSWGNKKEEAGTTGAFGIGFISVYQVTDTPEIFSSGRHWKFQPEATEKKRILATRIETKHTRFRLPWAFSASKTRQDLGIPPIEKSALDNYVKQIAESIEAAALFLKQVKRLEVKRNGRIVREIETIKEDGWILLSDGANDTRWRIIQGSFDNQAQEMRREYSSLIEAKRQAVVRLAIPETPLENGLLYAFLPSETHTGLPFHINADFYPSSDRKRILLDNDFKSEWNRLAIACATRILGSHLGSVLEIFPPSVFWKFSQAVKNASTSSSVDGAFNSFWEQIKPQIKTKATVLTSRNAKVIPDNVYYLDTDEEIAAADVLETLSLPTTHKDLRPYRNLLLEVGIKLLKPGDVGNACLAIGFDKPTSLEQLPAEIRSQSSWEIFWAALNETWKRASAAEQKASETLLKQCAIAFGTDGLLYPPSWLCSSDEPTQELFSKISKTPWLTRQTPMPLPGILVSEFGLLNGLEKIEANQQSLQEVFKTDRTIIREIYEWLSKYEASITKQSDLKTKIRQLAIWPSAEGMLKTLEQLYLAGDFDDPLNLADLVNIDVLGGRKEFLERVLQVKNLNFTNYVKDWLPSAFKSQRLPSEKKFRLLEVLAENLGKLQDDYHLKEILADLPLVWCGGELFATASSSYFETDDIHNVLGTDTLIVKLPHEHTESIQTLYRWMGVADEPRTTAIITHIRLLTANPPDDSSLQIFERIFSFLSTKWMFWDEPKRQGFAVLRNLAWLPGDKNAGQWFLPKDIYASYQNYLFESQGNFLRLEKSTQQKASDFIKFLGIPSEPTVELVVRHLLHCSKKEKPSNSQILTFLARNSLDPCIASLIGEPCLYLRLESGEQRYFRADQVFWDHHPFGKYRFRLGPEFGEFKPLFDRLEVKTKPGAQDAIKVLLEIASSSTALSNIPVEPSEDLEQVLISTWKLLGECLDRGEIKPNSLKKELGNQKTIPNAKKLLDKPERLFFEDRPGWGESFQLLKHNLIPRIEGAWLAMEAAGVQRISNAISTEIHDCVNSRVDTEIDRRIKDRRILVQRVIDAYTAKGIKGFTLDALDALKFESAERIEITRTFRGFNSSENTKQDVEAICLNGLLYYRKNGIDFPWLDIARELTYVLYPKGDINSLGMELKEILSSPTSAIANRNLDQLGYPRIEVQSPILDGPIAEVKIGGDSISENIHAETDVVSSVLGEKQADKPDNYPDHTRTTTTPDQEKTQDKEKKPSKLPERKTSRVVSYVYPEDTPRESAPEDDKMANRKKEIGKLGVAYVMDYEKVNGRTPTEMPTNNPGYDIKSIDAMGRVRYIEVKALTNLWDSNSPAQVTSTEFETAKELGTSYWLYVVELVETENRKIYKIQNPANQAGFYLFDHQWMELADKDEKGKIP